MLVDVAHLISGSLLQSQGFTSTGDAGAHARLRWTPKEFRSRSHNLEGFTRLGVYLRFLEGGMLVTGGCVPWRRTMEPDDKGERDLMVDQDGADDINEPDGENDDTVKDVDDIDLDLRQDSELDDDVDIGVLVIGGSHPVIVELDTEIDQNGEMDQDADVDSDAGDEEGYDIGISGEQRPEVDQRIEVDVEVSEDDDGNIIVEIDAEVEDDVEIESDLDVDVDDDDNDSIDAELDQDTESDGNVDVDIEIRDDLEADVDVDIASLIDTLVRGLVDIEEDEDGPDIDVDLEDEASADADVDIIVDLTDIDA